MYRIAQTNFCVSSLYSVVGFAHDLFFTNFWDIFLFGNLLFLFQEQ